MKQQINPMVAAGVAAIFLIVIGFFVWRGTGTSTVATTDKPIGPPPEFNQRMSGMSGAGGAPNASGGRGGAPTNASMPGTGNATGYMAPPPGK